MKTKPTRRLEARTFLARTAPGSMRDRRPQQGAIVKSLIFPRFVAVLALAYALHAASSEETPAAPHSEAVRVDSAATAAHMGQTVIVRGNVATVQGSSRTGKTYINFGKPFPNMEFSASFDTSNTDLANLKELEGRQGVEIEGTISTDQSGRPQIVITSLDQVKSRGESRAQRPANQTENSSQTVNSPDWSGGTQAAVEEPVSRSVVAQKGLVTALRQPGSPDVLQGRLVGVTDVEHWPERHTIWMTPAGANPAVSIKPAHAQERTTIALAELQQMMGSVIEVPYRGLEGNDNPHIVILSHEDPWISETDTGGQPVEEFNPLALFSDIPRLTVAELKKLEFPKPELASEFFLGLRRNKPVTIVGKLLSYQYDVLSFDYGPTGPPVLVIVAKGQEELEKLVGQEIAVIADYVNGPAPYSPAITISPVTFLFEGQPRPAVFLAEELRDLPYLSASHATPAKVGHGGAAKAPAPLPAPKRAPTPLPAPESPALQGTLLEPWRVELKRDGRIIGSTTLKAGTPLPIVRQEGVRALVQHAGGESWLLTGNEWEVTPIVELEEHVSADRVALALHANQPAVAWFTREGLWFAEQKGGRWQIELVDAFPEGNGHKNTYFRSADCALSVGEDGTVIIVYSPASGRDGKVVRRSGGDWTIERGLPAGHYTIRLTGDTPEILSVQSYRRELYLSRLQDGEWRAESLQKPPGNFHMLAAKLFDDDQVGLLVSEGPPSDREPKENQSNIQLRSLVGGEWKSELVETAAVPESPRFGRAGLTRAGRQTFAAYPLDDSSTFHLAHSSASWQIKKVNLDALGENPWLHGLATTADGVAFALFEGRFERAARTLLVESKKDDFLLAEKLLLRNTLAMTVDSEGHPLVLFQDADQNLSIATRKHVVQLATNKSEDGVLQLPSAQLTSTVPRPPLILPRKIIPGSEAEFARTIASPTPTFQFPVDGEMTQFTRWGSGDKVIVFFNHNGVTNSGGHDGKAKTTADSMPRDIEEDLPAYAPLFAAGYSLVVWSYPHTPQLSRKVGDLEKKPDLSGIASSVVDGIRKETGATEMILVGNSMGAGVLLWDLDKISSLDGVRTLLISPTEYFMPSIDRLGDGLPNTVLIAIQPDRHLRSPEVKAWAAKHASRPEGMLDGDFDEYSSHLIIGYDRLTQEEVARLIQEAAQPTNIGGPEAAPTQ